MKQGLVPVQSALGRVAGFFTPFQSSTKDPDFTLLTTADPKLQLMRNPKKPLAVKNLPVVIPRAKRVQKAALPVLRIRRVTLRQKPLLTLTLKPLPTTP